MVMFVFLQGEKGEDGIPGENGGMVKTTVVVNRPFPSYRKPHYEREAKWKAFLMKISFVCI